MQCAAERMQCAGVLRLLRGRAAAQLRGNVDYNYEAYTRVMKMHFEILGFHSKNTPSS